MEQPSLDTAYVYGYAYGMEERHRKAMALFVAGWLDKMSVGCFLVGLFQPIHMFGGITWGIICFLIGLCVKARVGE